VVRESTNASGQVVRQVRDSGGGIIELTLDRAGKLLGSRVLSGAGGQRAGSTSAPATAAQPAR
jgi:hypothetical protein